MTDDELIARSRAALERASRRPAREQLQPLIDMGVIDDSGRVLAWNADLGVVGFRSKENEPGQWCFRCLESIPGRPGLGEVFLRRAELVQAIREGRAVVTAYWNEHQRRWHEKDSVRLTPDGYLRVDDSDESGDDLGDIEHLPQENFSR